MNRMTILLAGVSLFAVQALAGSVSNVGGTLDTTIVDPDPKQYPHFICASGCSTGLGGVTQAGVWSIGVTNFPTTQTIAGTVSLSGPATVVNQPSLNIDGGGLSHVTNWPAIQPISGAISVSNLPTTQAISGAVSVSNLPATQAIVGSVSVGNFPTTQTVSGSVVVPGVAIAANQPQVNTDGGGLAHITNFPATQAVSGSISVSNLPATQQVSGGVSITNFPATQGVSGTVSVSGTASVQGAVSNGADGVGTGASNIAGLADLYGFNGATWDRLRDDASKYLFADVVGSAGVSLTQGTVAAGANSLNVYAGGGVGIGPPSTSTQSTVRYEIQTTPAGVPVDPTLPALAASNNASSSVTTGNTFQVLLASSSTRKGCALQNTSQDVEYIDVADATASATKARSFQVQPGTYFYCSQTSGIVISDLLSVTAPTTGDTFVMTSQ